MHHGPAFWRTVEWLVGDPGAPRSWLRRHGSRLRRYG
jgi:predicted metal-dependent hydrolase